MKKSIIKVLALTLALVMMIASGCTVQNTPATTGSAQQTQTEEKDPLDKSEYYSIVLLTEDAKLQENKDKNTFNQLLKEKFNFGFDYVIMTGDVREWLALRLASGDYPELTRIADEKFMKAYVEAGALVPLDDLIDKYGQNLKKTHEDRIPYWRVMSGLDDGKIWFYTTTEPAMSYGVSVAVNEWKIRSDIIEQQGYPEVRNEDDVYNILKQGLIDNPTTNGQPTIGFATPMRDPGSIVCIPYFFNQGRLSHMTLKNNTIFDIDKQEFINPVEDYDWKAGLIWYNKLWRENMVDKDAITYSSAEFQSKMGTGYNLATHFWGWQWNNWNTAFAQADSPYRYIPFPAQLKHMQEKGDMKVYPITNGELWSAYAITKNARYPERLMEVIDWCMSEEGLVRAGWGEEGVQYTVNSQGVRIPTEEHFQKTQSDPEYSYSWGGVGAFGLFAGLSENGQNFRMTSDKEYLNKSIDPKVFEVYGHYGWKDVFDSHNNNKNFEADFAYPAGFSMVIPNYSEDQVKNAERINIAVVDNIIKMITAESTELFEQYYQELIAECNRLDIQSLIDDRNALYNELQSKIK